MLWFLLFFLRTSLYLNFASVFVFKIFFCLNSLFAAKLCCLSWGFSFVKIVFICCNDITFPDWSTGSKKHLNYNVNSPYSVIICLFNLMLHVVSNCVITCFFLCTTRMIFFCFAETMRAPLTWKSATEGKHVIQVLNMLSVQSCSNADLIKCKDHWGCFTLYIPVGKFHIS